MHLINLMTSFAAVARTGSFTRAGAQLQVSKSVVSRHVSALEKQLGCQLIYRSTHSLSLTEAGEQFQRHCQELEAVAEQASGFAASPAGEPQGALRLTLPQTLVVSPVGKLISRFQKKFPGLQLDVRVTSLQVDPIGEGFDLALRIGNLRDSNLLCRKLRDVQFQAVAAPSYLRKHGVPKTVEDLKQHNCLSYSEFPSRTRWAVEDNDQRRKSVAVSGNLGTNSGVLLTHALLAGQGIVIGPDLMFEGMLKEGRVKAILEDNRFERSALYAVYPPGRFASANRKAFVDFLAAELTTRNSWNSGS
jgi:DNA-binding transcriptional LysR family regulator